MRVYALTGRACTEAELTAFIRQQRRKVARLDKVCRLGHIIASYLRAMNAPGAPDFSTPSLDYTPIPGIDRDYGLLGVKLGIAPEQLVDRVLANKWDDVEIYTRPTDSLQIGKAHLSQIEYWFKAGKLTVIMVMFSNEANGLLLRDAFSRVYGRGFGTDKLVRWSGAEASILFTTRSGEDGYLAIETN